MTTRPCLRLRMKLLFSLLAWASITMNPAAQQPPAPPSSQPFLLLRPPKPATWSAEAQPCADETTHPFISTRPREEATGSLRSREFVAPPRLSFWIAGASNQGKNFIRLRDGETSRVLREEPTPRNDIAQKIEWDLSDLKSHRRSVFIEIVDGDTGSGWAWIAVGRFEPAVVAMPDAAGAAIPPDWTSETPPLEEILLSGIPFLKGSFWGHFAEGQSVILNFQGLRADTVYLLGGINAPDQANPPWGGGNTFQNLFIGDSAGAIRVSYSSGKSSEIPLVFGHSIWWRGPFITDPEPFKSDAGARDILDRALCVANGLAPATIASDTEPPLMFLALHLAGEAVDSITVLDNKDKIGHLEVLGVTLENATAPSVSDDRFLPPTTATLGLSPDTAVWLESHRIDPTEPFPAARRAAIDQLRKLLYVFPDDITEETIANTPPAVTPESFSGPKLAFKGSPTATLLTRIYYENALGMADRIEPTGMVHESATKADYYGGFGGHRRDLQAFWDASYTRIRILMLLSELGYTDKVESALDFFGHWILYFPNSYPQIQMGGKPIPGHATVVANKPHVYFDELSKAGWPTRFKTRDFGNPENDGHGMLMLSHYRQWIREGRSESWVRHRWNVIREMAEYIPWSLDNPELSLSEHGLLYSESEGGMTTETIYCDMPCYFGLLAFAEMAERVGKTALAERWRACAGKLADAVEAYYPTILEPWGDVWNPDKTGAWAGRHSVLAPLLFGCDYWGYDAALEMPASWRERTRRTYEMQLTHNEPRWCTPAGLGYGQCYITESALLLDRMNDAEHMLDWLARFCFSPRQTHPYRVPEGITMAADGSIWRRWGDLGNLYQLGETVYTIRILTGINDHNPNALRLMPRLPFGWTEIAVSDQPVRILSEGRSQIATIAYSLKSNPDHTDFEFTLESDRPLDTCRVRIGPFPREIVTVKVDFDGRSASQSPEEIGDARWAWISLDAGWKGILALRARGASE